MFIHCSDEGLKAELEGLLGDEILKREPELSNGVDDLRFVLMVSKVNREVCRSCWACLGRALNVWAARTGQDSSGTPHRGVLLSVLLGLRARSRFLILRLSCLDQSTHAPQLVSPPSSVRRYVRVAANSTSVKITASETFPFPS